MMTTKQILILFGVALWIFTGLVIWTVSEHIDNEKTEDISEQSFNNIVEFEEWDYTVYDTVKDANCLYYCYHETNTSDCESACKMYKVKLYTDSYCNVSCSEHDNTTFNYTITIDSSQGTMIGAFLIDFDYNETITSCNYKCYGKFGGYTYGD